MTNSNTVFDKQLEKGVFKLFESVKSRDDDRSISPKAQELKSARAQRDKVKVEDNDDYQSSPGHKYSKTQYGKFRPESLSPDKIEENLKTGD